MGWAGDVWYFKSDNPQIALTATGSTRELCAY